MKIQIDTTQKVIKLESSENMGDFFTAIQEMLPNCLWKEFKLETNTVITWTNPIIWRDIYVRPTYIPAPTIPYIHITEYPTTPWITYQKNTNIPQLQAGTFNVQF